MKKANSSTFLVLYSFVLLPKKDRIKLDFAEIWTDDYAHEQGLTHGVRFVGESSSKIQMGNYVNQTEPAFWFLWSSKDPKANRGVFHWEFTGLAWAGGTDNTLLQFGPHVAWNSCKFEVRSLKRSGTHLFQQTIFDCSCF